MNFLGSVSQLYVFVLLVLLFLGSGFALWRFVNFVIEQYKVKSKTPEKPKLNEVVKGNNKIEEFNKKLGGLIMSNNGWLKLAVFSFVGILVSVVILGFVSTGNASASNNIHQQHVQQGLMGNGQTQGNMNMQNSNNMQGYGYANSGMQDNSMMLQQQLNQMQQQLNQMQQQFGGMYGGNQMQSGMNNNANSGMGMMSGTMGNMNNMNSMPQNNNNMNNMQQNSSNMQQSSSGMGMM